MVDDHVPRSIAVVFFFYWAYTIFRHTHITVLIINYIYIYMVGGFNPSEKY